MNSMSNAILPNDEINMLLLLLFRLIILNWYVYCTIIFKTINDMNRLLRIIIIISVINI